MPVCVGSKLNGSIYAFTIHFGTGRGAKTFVNAAEAIEADNFLIRLDFCYWALFCIFSLKYPSPLLRYVGIGGGGGGLVFFCKKNKRNG